MANGGQSKWQVKITHLSKQKMIGYTHDEHEGARWYDEWCKKIGRFDKMNFPHEHTDLSAEQLKEMGVQHRQKKMVSRH